MDILKKLPLLDGLTADFVGKIAAAATEVVIVYNTPPVKSSICTINNYDIKYYYNQNDVIIPFYTN